MAQPYYRRRTYKATSSGSNAAFVTVILLACVAWAHRAFMTKVEHYVLLAWLVGGAIFLATIIYKLGKKLYVWKRKYHKFSSPIDMTTIDHMTGLEFERYVAQLLNAQGYGAIRLTQEFDYGVDIIAVKDGVSWGIQVKRYSGLVKASAVRQVVTALKKYRCDRAMVVTNSGYSQVALELARINDCLMIDRQKLLQWVAAS